MLVPVLDTNRKPLMPVKPALARLLLTQKKASAYWNKLGIFCIILHKAVDNPSLQQLVVGIDPGSSFEGWSVVGTRDTVLNGMSEAPTHIKDAVEVRKNMRRSRRQKNCRRRQARFDNRHKCKLPPSTRARWNLKLRILSTRRRRSRTIGASGERSNLSSSAETSQTFFTEEMAGNIRANGFSSRCFRSRRRRTAVSLRASTKR